MFNQPMCFVEQVVSSWNGEELGTSTLTLVWSPLHLYRQAG